MARKASSGTPATVALTRARVAFTLHPYAHAQGATNFGNEAAFALGVDPDRIFKTLVVEAGAEMVVAVVPVSGLLDLKAVAAAVGGKRAAMADATVAARVTGYVVGGISPLGQRTPLRTLLDVSARRFPTIFVSAGRRGLQMELAPDDLVRVTAADVCALSA